MVGFLDGLGRARMEGKWARGRKGWYGNGQEWGRARNGNGQGMDWERIGNGAGRKLHI